jgi:hypothetical protein
MPAEQQFQISPEMIDALGGNALGLGLWRVSRDAQVSRQIRLDGQEPCPAHPGGPSGGFGAVTENSKVAKSSDYFVSTNLVA